jgi:formylglycine-generating enzyme required for sulfatase activity
MKKCLLFIFLGFYILGLSAQSPNPCALGSPVTAKFPAAITVLDNLFSQAKQAAELSPQACEDLKSRINLCNNDMEVELGGIVAEMSELSLKYQQILGYKDVAGIEKQLRDLEGSLQKSRSELEQNLSYVKHSGVYVVLIENVDFYKTEKKDLIEQANRAITPKAVSDLVGASINRSSNIRDFAPVRDLILQVNNGEVRMEREYFNQPNPVNKTFMLVARIGAVPTRQKPVGTGPAVTAALVLNLAVDTDYRKQLLAKGVREVDIRRIEQEVIPFLTTIQRDNRTADERQDYILQNGAEEIRRIEADITDARLRLQTRSGKIAEICKELGVPFKGGTDFDQSVTGSLQKIRDELATLTTSWNKTIEREIVYKETQTFVEGALAQSLASEAHKLCQQIEKGYGQLDRILQVTEVQNFDMTRFENNRTVTVYRKPRQIWAYAMPKTDGSYGVVVFMQFEVTGQEVAKAEGEPKPYNTIENSDFQGYSPGQGSPPSQIRPYEPEMVKVLGGSFLMDSKYWVKLSDFFISKYEVTNEQYVYFLNDISPNMTFNSSHRAIYKKIEIVPCRFNYSRGEVAGGTFSVEKGYEKHPASCVSWNMASLFIEWLNSKTNKEYKLPTEAEWEFAAMGGTKTRKYDYAGSNKLKDVGWYRGNSKGPKPVGQKTANELGLYDLSGNVAEWCNDWYGSYPEASTETFTNPTGPIGGAYRIFRGGSYNNEDGSSCTIKTRHYAYPNVNNDYLGFRIARPSQ